MTDIDAARAAEHAKYERCYGGPQRYQMGGQRMADAVRHLSDLPCRGSYLDVATGRGEMLRHAAALGFDPAQGTEVVPDLIRGPVVRAEAHSLPFRNACFDVVTLFDVIEHLLPGDDEAACRELARVARRHVLIAANNRPSFNHAGDDLHINKRPYDEWDALFRAWFPGAVSRLDVTYHSQMWRVDL